MQSVFNVTSIVGDYTNKRITIETNFTVDKDTVNKRNVKVVDALSGTTVVYKLSVDKKNIIITLKDWPNLNQEYQINVTDIKDMLNRDLVNPISKFIEFKADTKLKARITSPRNNEAIVSKNNLVYFSLEQLNPDGTITVIPKPEPYSVKLPNAISSEEATEEVESDVKYHFEFASDVAFFDIVKDYYSSVFTDGCIELDNNQYYMRARIIENDLPGDWSDIVTFTVTPDGCECDNNDILSEAQKQYLDEVFAPVDFFLDDEEDLIIVSKSPNGETLSEFYIEFNMDLDPDSVPEQIIAYRRDL